VKTVLRVNPQRVLARTYEIIYGQFIEHFGSVVYGGIYDPQSPLADGDGFRSDVLAALSGLDIPVLRWPGGCFASAYHWRDGVGRVREPFTTRPGAWRSPTRFGTDEFLRLCERLNAEPYLCTNAGTGTPEEMADWVEYCNEPSLGRNVRLRRQNGREKPYGVRYWSIGNENYTGGEIGSKRAGEWGAFVRESAKMMRRVDASVQLFAAGVNDLDWNLALLRRRAT
jgi:alpha-N-arabinofuranosidase